MSGGLELRRCGGPTDLEDPDFLWSITGNVQVEQLRQLYVELRDIEAIPEDERTDAQRAWLAEIRGQSTEIARDLEELYDVDAELFSVYPAALTNDRSTFDDPTHTVGGPQRVHIGASRRSPVVSGQIVTFSVAPGETEFVAPGTAPQGVVDGSWRITAPDGTTETSSDTVLELLADRDGRWTVEVDARLRGGVRTTLRREIDVIDAGTLADVTIVTSELQDRLASGEVPTGNSIAALIRTNLELERLRVGRFRDFAMQNERQAASTPRITTQVANPVRVGGRPVT